MSATGRGKKRRLHDDYPTPKWCVDRLMEAINLPGGRWIEPCAGEGNIIRSLPDKDWTAVELRESCRPYLLQLGVPTFIENYLEFKPDNIWDVAMTNPPYATAMDVLLKTLTLSKWCVFLLRLGFLASEKRNVFMRRKTPDIYILPNRPSYDGEGTDASDYAWCVWNNFWRYPRKGTVTILKTTPQDVRDEAKQLSKEHNERRRQETV